MPLEIRTVEEFELLSHSEGIVIIHFWADWNSTDYVMKKILCEIENELLDNVLFGSIDADLENLYELFRSLSIVNVPILLYFKNGKRLLVEVGYDGRNSEAKKKQIKSKILFLKENK